MTQQELQYAYWRNLRQRQIYNAYAVSMDSQKERRNKVSIALEAYDSSHEPYSRVQNPGLNISISADGVYYGTCQYSDFPIQFNCGQAISLSAYPENDYEVQVGEYYIKGWQMSSDEQYVIGAYNLTAVNDCTISVYCGFKTSQETVDQSPDESMDINYEELDDLL